MSSQHSFRMDWCTYEAAKYACEHWHYSRALPAGPTVKLGVWEQEKFVGVVIYSHGANQHVGSPYELSQQEAVELTRVALRKHETPVSKILAISLRMLKKKCPNLRLVISYADADQNHHGGIYQATGWVYTGLKKTNSRTAFIINGKKTHPRSIACKGVKQSIQEVRKHLDKNATEFFSLGKHKYLMPLDAEMRNRVEKLRQPYPKRAGSAGSGTSPDQGGRGGATPTPALSSTET